ncbi:MAG: excinuclease ABC subunit UvrC [Mangrovibacterium sp.]
MSDNVKNKDSERLIRLKELVHVLPHQPGIYQYFDSTGKVIYVGKAKDLKKRVSSYFNKNHDNRKTTLLVRNIVDIKHMVVETEQDALLLENNLIKKYQPRYNIRLKDDKTYPWIVIKKEPFPRIFQTRNVIRDGSEYYGPYTSILAVRTLLEMFRKLYRIRTCKLNLSHDNIASGKYKICLQYHIGNCKAPCEGRQSVENYELAIQDIRAILKGNISNVIRYLKQQMQELAGLYKFEEAQEIKEKLLHLEKFQNKSTVVSSTITNVDVFSIDIKDSLAYVNYLKIIDGSIVQTFTTEMKMALDESRKELLQYAIIDIRQKIFSNAKELIVPFHPKIELEGILFKIPERGDKKRLLDLSLRNAKYYRLEKEKQLALRKPKEDRTTRILERMKSDLRLHVPPALIECFDNSNLQGTNPVAACVVFRNTKPAKREYRHFNVKTVVGPDDFESMREIVYRRYKRQVEEQKQLPDLIVIDGGKGQLGAALEALERLNLRGKIPIIGIAKRLEEIYFPGDTVPLYLDKNSETLKIIQQARDEAHRFGITFHRNQRSKNFIKSELSDIPGIGNQTIQQLMRLFGSLDNLKKQSFQTVANEIGRARTMKIFEYFKLKID